MSSADRNSAYMFFGRCRAASAMKGHGLLATLQYYDEQGMLNIKFLHDWLATRPAHANHVPRPPKRLYVGGAQPEPVGEEGIHLAMLAKPLEAFRRINRELLAYARRSGSLREFLERVSLHSNELLG